MIIKHEDLTLSEVNLKILVFTCTHTNLYTSLYCMAFYMPSICYSEWHHALVNGRGGVGAWTQQAHSSHFSPTMELYYYGKMQNTSNNSRTTGRNGTVTCTLRARGCSQQVGSVAAQLELRQRRLSAATTSSDLGTELESVLAGLRSQITAPTCLAWNANTWC